MKLIEAIDNSVLVIFVAIMGFTLFILHNILKFIMNRTSREVRDPYNINFNSENISDPYAHSNLHDDCSICTERIKYKVELDCNHSFCGKCIMDYYDTVRPSNLKCPLCRNPVRIINSENLVRDANTRDFYDNIVRYNHRNTNGWNYYVCYFTDFSYIFYRGIFNIFNNGELLFYFIIGFVIVIIYILAPVDVIPDAYGWIGYIDDVSMMIGFVIWIMNNFYRAFSGRVDDEYRQINAQ